ncbi:hypothetical protein PO909_023919 [Leuciscus waleckii]
MPQKKTMLDLATQRPPDLFPGAQSSPASLPPPLPITHLLLRGSASGILVSNSTLARGSPGSATKPITPPRLIDQLAPPGSLAPPAPS